MRTVFTFIVSLFISGILLGQQIQTDVEATVNIDDFTGNITIRTENWRNIAEDRNRNRLTARLVSVHEDIVIGIHLTYSGNLGCLSENRSTLMVKLTNDEVIEFIQVSQTDCGSRGQSAIFWPITSDELSGISDIEDLYEIAEDRIHMLYSYDWVSMRLTGSRYRTDLHVNESRRVPHPEQFFRQHIQAIRNAYAQHK